MAGFGEDHSPNVFKLQMAFPSVLQRPAVSIQKQFYNAISAEDEKEFLKLLHHPDVSMNADRGRALWYAAEKKNYYFMRELVMAGADLKFAVETANELYNQKWSIHYEMKKNDPAKAEAAKMATHYQNVSYCLSSYESDFAEKVAPIESARAAQKMIELQAQTLQAMLQLQQQIQEQNTPNTVQKLTRKALPSPKEI